MYEAYQSIRQWGCTPREASPRLPQNATPSGLVFIQTLSAGCVNQNRLSQNNLSLQQIIISLSFTNGVYVLGLSSILIRFTFLFTPKKIHHLPPVTINNCSISRTNHIKFLVITFDESIYLSTISIILHYESSDTLRCFNKQNIKFEVASNIFQYIRKFGCKVVRSNEGTNLL